MLNLKTNRLPTFNAPFYAEFWRGPVSENRADEIPIVCLLCRCIVSDLRKI